MKDWRTYDRVAEIYERVHAPRMGLVGADLVDVAEIGPGMRAIDVGTGTGVAAAAAADRVGPSGLAVGIDISLEMMTVGRALRPEVRFVRAEAIDLPFRDRTFHGLTCNFVLHHFTRYDTALFDMIRVARPGGRLALSTWGAGEDDLDKTWRELLEEAVGQEMLRDVWRQSTPWRQRFADREKIEETLLQAGLKRVRTEAKEYRFTYSIDDYVDARTSMATGRFLREMIGDARFAEFEGRARERYRERFADPLNDFRDVWLAVATRP